MSDTRFQWRKQPSDFGPDYYVLYVGDVRVGAVWFSERLNKWVVHTSFFDVGAQHNAIYRIRHDAIKALEGGVESLIARMGLTWK